MSNTWTTSGRRAGRRELHAARVDGSSVKHVDADVARAAADRAPLEDARDGRVVLVDPRRRQLDAEDEDDRRADDDERAGSLKLCVYISFEELTAGVVIETVPRPRDPHEFLLASCFTGRAAEKFDRCARVHERAASPAHRPPPRRRVAVPQAVAAVGEAAQLFVPAGSCPAPPHR